MRFTHEDPDNLTLVIVTHGISLRVFLMRWYKYDFQQFGAHLEGIRLVRIGRLVLVGSAIDLYVTGAD